MAGNKPHTLYICYFGLREALVQTQVLPYLREIQKGGLKVSLLTFEPDFREKWTAQEIETQRKKLADENIDWHCLAYHKRPSAPATAFDVLCGAYFIWKMIRREKINVLHARIHVPMLMATLARKFSRRKPKIIFDIRGFFAEEYLDGGVWKETDLIYRLTKKVERWLMKEADAFVVLTEKARSLLFPESEKTGFDKTGRPVEVIPCCVDYSRLKSFGKQQKSPRFELIYAGTVTGLYLLEEMGRLFLALKKKQPDAFFRILTASPPEAVVRVFERLEIKSEDYSVAKTAPSEVLEYMQKAHLAVSFRKPTYAQIASSPTKIPEFLAAGLPVISNYGIGDTDKVLLENKVGVIVNEFSERNYNEALTEIDALFEAENLSEQCRLIAYKNFDLGSVGGERYRRLYRKLLQT